MAAVDILLATYNGARYLPELLASLEAQTFRDWRLIVRDDGSSDGSLALVEDWAAAAGRALTVLRDGDRGLGPRSSFARLLAASDAPHFLFCDQDDLWRPEKVAVLLEAARAAEVEAGAGQPVLAHCDLAVVDRDLATLHPSFWDQQGYTYRAARAGAGDSHIRKSLILRNFVTGCAMLGNADLRRAMLPVPETMSMHDWWAAHIAAQYGRIVAVDRPLIDYRQHGQNAVGARVRTFRMMIERLFTEPRKALERTRKASRMLSSQAGAVLARFGADMTAPERRFAADFAALGRGLRRASGWRLLWWSLGEKRHRALTTLILFETISPTAGRTGSTPPRSP